MGGRYLHVMASELSVTLESLEASNSPRRVRTISTGKEFMISAVRGTAGVVAVAPFEIGSARPAPGEHKMLEWWEREAWFAELEFVN